MAQARREKAAREHRDIRQTDVAKAIGVSGATISDCEADKKVPSEPILARLAEFLEVTPAYLRYGVGEPANGERALLDPSRDRRLTDAEIQRARDAVAAEEQAGKSAAKKRRGRTA